MHFIDFLLHLICFICWALKTVYIFSIDYVIPVVFGQIIPVLIKYLSQLFTILLRIFFTYISPCVIQLLNGATYVFTRVLNAISVASMTIIESDVNLEYAHAILMASILVVIVYFHITEKITRFFFGWYQITSLYLRFLLSVLKMLRFCLNFAFQRVTTIFSNTPHHSNDDATTSSNGRKGHQNHQRPKHTNQVNGTSSLNGRKSQ